MGRITLIQTLVKEFLPEDEILLRDMNPGMFGGMLEVKPAAQSTDFISPPQPEKKRGWDFGKK